MATFKHIELNRPDRRPIFQPLNTKDTAEFVSTKHENGTLYLSVYPTFNSGFTETDFKIHYPNNWNANYLDAIGFKSKLEICGNAYEGYFVSIAGLSIDEHEQKEQREDNGLNIGVWLLRNLRTNEKTTYTAFIKYGLPDMAYRRLITKYFFDGYGEKIASKDIRLSVGNVDLRNLSQNYTSSITAAGMKYEFTDSVKNIHALGSTQETYMHYKCGYVAPTYTGKAFIIAELTFGRGYEAIVFDKGANTKNVFKSANFYTLQDTLHGL